jgi:RNA ligase (TIGR02306 family)
VAFFGVTVEKIESVLANPHADRLETAKCEGMSFIFVVQRGFYKPGDAVLYFPLDSILPDGLIAKLGMTGKFSEEKKNIVKTCSFRGQISQGFVAMASEIIPAELLGAGPAAITEHLGVKKYEVEPVDLKDTILTGLPSGYSAYDIAGADRNQDIIELLLDQDVAVLEKMEGENSSYGSVLGDRFVNCRERSIVEKPGFQNQLWNIAREHGLHDLVDKLGQDSAMLYAEACGPGIYGNHYNLSKKTAYLFDIRAGVWVDFLKFEKFLSENGKADLMAPVIFRGKLRNFLAGRTIQDASNGSSLVNKSALREGVVIKPFIEQQHQRLGRLIIKQRSPEYLKQTGR